MVALAGEEPPRQSLQGSWPLKLFGLPREFNREAENQPYIEWVQGSYGNFEGSSDEEDDEDEDEDDNKDNEDCDGSVCISQLCQHYLNVSRVSLYLKLFQPSSLFRH
jgi:hypothetical protein